MGIKKMFKKKEPTEEELREDLNRVGISTKSGNTREQKFGAFKQYAEEKKHQKPALAPVNPYQNLGNGNGDGGNPYAQTDDGGSNNGASPYEQSDSPYGQNGNSPYEQNNSSPYASQRNPYSGARRSGANEARNPSSYNRPSGQSHSQSASARQPTTKNSRPYDPYSQAPSLTRESTRTDTSDNASLDLNEIPTNQMYVQKKPVRRPAGQRDDLDLNDLPEEEDLNVDINDLPEEEEVNSEDEEVEAIKQDIRFTKQESLASTRNTLRMAQEADASGTNTLGMLGSQSERLYGAEQNILLADTQTEIANEKVKELRRLNRSIFVPAYGNPFNKKSRLRQQEENIKANKIQEKYMRENNRSQMYASEQRIKQGITQNVASSELHQKYQGEKDLQAAKRYQFENDSEDDEMEKELASNLDEISLYAKKLKGTANTMGNEVDTQNNRLRKIEEDADRLDINVHMNSARLNNIR